jgi:hypothetical protein
LNVCSPLEGLWKPPLRQAAIPLSASGESVVEKVSRIENEVQFDNVAELSIVPKTKYKPKVKRN